MSDFLLFIFGTALINNIIVGHLVGADPALAFTKRLDVAKGLSITMLVLLPLATLVAFSTRHYLLLPLELDYLQLPLLLTLIILLAGLLKILLPGLHKLLGERVSVFLPLAAINATVLGTVLLNLELSNNALKSLTYGFATALGFALVLLLLTPIREKLESADVPLAFQGLSITLITLGLLAMSFMGFAGLVNTP